MRSSHVKRALREGRPTVGTWLSYPSPPMVEAMAHVGFDWLTLDMEHNAMSIETAAHCMAMMRGTPTAPLARLPNGTHENIKRVLDAGAWGVVCPMVNTPEQAEIIARAAKHPPEGNRSFGGGRYNASWGAVGGEYRENINNEVVVVIMMESPEGVNNLEKIFQVGGIDACFVGPNDLLGNMGEKPSMWSDSKQFRDALDHLLEMGRKYGVAPGIHCADAAAVSARIAEGFQFLALASEARFMLHEATTEMNAVKGWSPNQNTEVIKY
ncbi:MAG TPA: aldolase/citrate lyase family protein [Thermomicrobiales bacterium]|nr:aldolase/citrate lyase family protein [Thermomicrobiales bacterium]